VFKGYFRKLAYIAVLRINPFSSRDAVEVRGGGSTGVITVLLIFREARASKSREIAYKKVRILSKIL
jgi:hypothetical protein